MSKKISQLTEKITQLDQNDLFLVTTNGESKSVKVSTLEAPLKTYADNKASQAQSAAIASANAALQSAINTEVARATGVESGLQTQISSEVTRAQAAESSLSSAISSEVSNRQAADVVVLQDAKDYADQKLSELVASAPAVLDTLNELAQALNDDANFATTISNQLNQLDSDIDSEVTRAQAAESSLSSALNSEISTRIANDSAEESARIAADSSLQIAINNEVTRASNAESSISTVVSNNTPIGVMFLYAGNTAPTGWLLCDGTAINRTTYAPLFSVIGTAYGVGNGSTTFNLPNPDSNSNLKYIIKA